MDIFKKFKKKKEMDAETIDALVKKVQRAYNKEWREKNPEKVKAIRERFWKKKAEKMNLL
ncbi:MAG: hypothetical protein KG029_12270 [Bacteroidetes bacterium]|nr:hypothetical protein [Bacteroidota bacterium]